jgi:hypothetical protein
MPEIIDMAGLPISDRTDPILVPNTRSGGMAINGVEQVVSPLSSQWKFRAILPINTVGRARAWRATLAKMEGRWNYLRFRICDRARIGRRDIGAVFDGSEVPHSDDTYFSDESGYALASPASPLQVASERGATSVRVLASDFAGAMTAGVFFSVNDWLHVVTDWALAGDDNEYIDITFKPPLRAAADVGDTVDFDAKAIWVFDADDVGKMPLRLGRFGEVELMLTEAIGRAE